MKIAIPGDGFISWGGGIDFLKSYINAIYERPDAELTVYIPDRRCIKETVKNIIRPYKWLIEGLIREKIISFKRPEIIDIDAIMADLRNEFPKLNVVSYFASQQNFERLVTEAKEDIIFPCMYSLGERFPIPWIGYIYDLQHKYHPRFFTEQECEARDSQFTKMLNESRGVIVNARSVRDDLIKYYSDAAATTRIYAAPFAPVPQKEWSDLGDVSLERYHLPSKYFMIANQFWIHKDHLTAFKALAKLPDRYGDIHIVCTGKMVDYRDPQYISRLRLSIDDLGITNRVHFLGYIPKLDQIKIMSNAIAVVQPTLFEGGPGGGATYNAISIGKRVILSDIPVNLEVDSELAVLFRSEVVDDLSDKMRQILSQKEPLIERNELLMRGAEHRQRLGDFMMDMLSEHIRINGLA